jgi:hypothetical protein
MNQRVKVLDTDEFLAMEMADSLLAEAHIPHFIVEFTRSGASCEMPCAPAFGRGFSWYIVVGPEHQAEAEAVLSGLPFEQTRSLGRSDDLDHSTKSRRWWLYYGLLIASLILLAVLLPRFSR